MTKDVRKKGQRAYERSHPWLTFHADLSRAGHDLWMNLGAVQSKCEHVARVMLPPAIAEELLQVHLAKGVRATTAIEGNTLSEEEVLERVRGRPSELAKSKEYQGLEVDNVIAACNEIRGDALGGQDVGLRLTIEKIARYNKLVLNGLELEEGVVPGEISSHNVGVGAYRGAPRKDCEHLLKRLCAWINDEIRPPSPDQEIAFGVLRAVLAHLYLAWIHPFGDGNGRTARLVELHLLLAANVPSIAAHLLSNHYNLTRSEYYRQLDYASRSGGDVLRFLSYAVQGLFDGLNETIKEIQTHQFRVAWSDYVYEAFKDQSGTAADRRRQVALDLFFAGLQGAAISRIRMISAKVAEMYAGKTSKTVTRDLNELEAMDLVRRDGRRVHANAGLLLSFLPDRRGRAASPAEARAGTGNV